MITFRDRSNQYASNVFFDGSNLFIDAGDLSLPALVMSGGAGIVYAATTGASINTSYQSAFYNLDFTPVDGDIVELPTVWQGSTITVAANGFFTISPALSNGTTIPRRAYDLSAGIWYQDTITINDPAGLGSLFTSAITLSGSGAAIPRTTGAGDIQVPALTLAGVGSITTTAQGAGALTAPGITLAGAGNVYDVVAGAGNLQLSPVSLTGIGSVTSSAAGVGSLFTPAVTLSGVGSIILPNMPVIADGGDLVVHVPYYSMAASVDYPEISAWIAQFSSSVKVSNNLPILPLVDNSPHTVIFSATNQFGTTTLTRTLTIIVDDIQAPMDTNQADLRLSFPYFADPNFFSYQQLELAVMAARGQIPATNYGRLQGPQRLRAIYLLAAHMLYIQKQASGGGTAGVVTASAVDKVSVAMMAPPAKTQWAWWLSQSPYGVELQGLLATKGAGGFYVPGSIERFGFRKGGGGF